jgi:aminoglycoside phosphotransferase (APT) family kinase protein
MQYAPQPVRPGEELPLPALEAYLQNRLGGAEPLAVSQFPGGYSNLTYLLRRGGGEYVLRRPPVGANVKSGHDMEREFNVLSAIRPQYARVPRPILYCGDAAVIGAPFYLMERVDGLILRGPRPEGLAADAPTMRRLSEALVDNLAEIHAVDVTRPEVAALGRPGGYVGRQVAGWAKRYHHARTDDLADMDRVAAWLAGHQPPERYVGLVHNDYKYDNVVFAPGPGDIRAVLDWEMATVGDPLMDLGTTLGYWAEPGDPAPLLGFGPTALPGNLTRRQVAERYAGRTGRDLGDVVFYYAFGLFKIGVIVQQIYARYRQGLTQDPRFAGLIHVLRACAAQADAAIASGKIGEK